METPNSDFIIGEETGPPGSVREAVEDPAKVKGKLESGDMGEEISLPRTGMTKGTILNGISLIVIRNKETRL